MCKKLIVVLVILAMAVPALAITRGHYLDAAPTLTDANSVILMVDLNAQGVADDVNDVQPGWVGWEAGAYFGSYGPLTKDFGYGSGLPEITIDGISNGAGGSMGGSRNRTTPVGDEASDLALMYKDLWYVGGGNQIKMDLVFEPNMAGEAIQITLFGWDPAFKGSGIAGFGGAGEPEDSKRAAWGTLDPSGYDYTNTNGEPNMPAELADATEVAICLGTATWLSQYDDAYGMLYSATLDITLDDNASATIYGWQDMLSPAGSSHLPLNGFIISLPEPAPAVAD